ncbi:MAG TPA: hypothetical protein VM370_06130 [Candidatus Thermoplasmatota archaeon]|nr:hypothetical protein [Candidatus Thermoplasmatota archaeon]
MPATLLGSLSSWNNLERAVDRWASLGALTFALVAGVTFLLLF